MKFAAIMPPHVLDEVGLLTSYHLVLAQEAIRSDAYQKHYRKASRLGHFIIVDNGAAENDTPPFKEVIDLANTLRADEVALPDVLYERLQTYHLIKHHMHVVPPTARMLIPQGDSIEDWTRSLAELDRLLEGRYASIGVPKHLEKHEGGRVRALKAIMTLNLHETHYIHLLGISEHTFSELVDCATLPLKIRGFDTGAPVAQAQHGQRISHTPQRRHSLEWDMIADSELVTKNVASVLFWANSLRKITLHA